MRDSINGDHIRGSPDASNDDGVKYPMGRVSDDCYPDSNGSPRDGTTVTRNTI